MRNSIFLFVLFCLLSACNNDNSTPSTTSTDSTNTENVNPSTTASPDKAPTELLLKYIGVYTKGGHDKSWMLTLRTLENGLLEAILIEFNGMIPPVDYLMEGNEVDGEYQILEEVAIAPNSNLMRCNLGSATIDGTKIVFEEIIDNNNEKLTLERDDIYLPLLES